MVFHVCIDICVFGASKTKANISYLGILFCDPGCPFCPPGIMGDGNLAGEGEENQQSSTESESSTQSSASYTVLYGVNYQPDSFPATFAAMTDLSVSICSIFH